VAVAALLGLMVTACAAPPDAATPGSPSVTPRSGETPEATPTSVASATAVSTPDAEVVLAWTSLDIAGPAPAPREDHTWTVDGAGGLAYLFGGRDGATVYGDLWAFDLGTEAWREIDAGGGPPVRFGHEAVWVDDVGLVVFAGQAGSTFFDDLWAFDPGTGAWRSLPSAGDVPVARYGTCAAIGPDGRLWISHGFTSDGTRFSDTVAYDFASGAWSDETPAGARPVERCLHGCWWTDAGELALYAGQTTGITALGDRWTLADGAWARQDGSLPPDRNLYARARLASGTLVFGGQAIDGSYLADLWRIDDGAPDAVVLEPAGEPPPGRAGAELVRDDDRSRILLFGGRDADGARADLWQLALPAADGG
jgi:hypothetical protein